MSRGRRSPRGKSRPSATLHATRTTHNDTIRRKTVLIFIFIDDDFCYIFPAPSFVTILSSTLLKNVSYDPPLTLFPLKKYTMTTTTTHGNDNDDDTDRTHAIIHAYQPQPHGRRSHLCEQPPGPGASASFSSHSSWRAPEEERNAPPRRTFLRTAASTPTTTTSPGRLQTPGFIRGVPTRCDDSQDAPSRLSSIF